MRNQFNLRFRRKRLAAVAGLVLALAVTPFLQASQAAGSARLDMDLASAIIKGPNAPTGFKNSVAVQNGNTVQVSTLVHNTENANSGRSAENFRIRVTVPKGPGTNLNLKGEVTASNDAPSNVFKSSDTNQFTSANGKPFSLTRPRQDSFQIVRNEIPDSQCNQAKFNYGKPKSLPEDRIRIKDNGSSYEVIVDPNGNGKLDPCFCRILAVRFLLDVTQPIIQTSPSPSPSASPSPSPSPSASPSPSPTPTASPTPTPTPTATPTPTPTPEMTPTPTPIPTPTSTPTPTATPTPNIDEKGNLMVIKFHDKNGNGKHDEGEPGLPSVHFTISGPSAVLPISPTGANDKPLNDLDNQMANTEGEADQSNSSETTGRVVALSTQSPSPVASPSGSPITHHDPCEAVGACQKKATNSEGKISLLNLKPGHYSVIEQVPAGYAATTPTTQVIEVKKNQTAELKFGNRKVDKETTPTPTPTVTPTPNPTASPTPPGGGGGTDFNKSGGQAPPGELPKTGAAEAAMVSLLALATSLYLYFRGRRALRQAVQEYRIK